MWLFFSGSVIESTTLPITLILSNANYQMKLVIVVDSIGFQFPITQLPVSVVEAETRLGRWRPVRVVDGWGGRWRRLHDRKLVHITVRGFVDVVEAGRGSLVQI